MADSNACKAPPRFYWMASRDVSQMAPISGIVLGCRSGAITNTSETQPGLELELLPSIQVLEDLSTIKEHKGPISGRDM